MVSTTNEPVRIRTSEDYTYQNPAVIGNDPQVIRAQIEKTRAQMGHTLDEIQVRLSPEYIKQQAQESIREATVEKVEKMAQTANRKVNNWRSNAVQTVKDNPVPAAMVGIGLGWLLLSDHNNRDDYEYAERYYGNMGEGPSTGYYTRRPDYENRQQGMLAEAQDRFSETAENAREWVDEQGEQVKQTAQNVAATVQNQAAATSEAVRENVSDVTSRAQEYMSETAENARIRAEEARMQARYQARRVKRTFWQTMEENPLVIGAAAAAAGALVGLALPGTEKENELMGETRDRLVREASATAEETMHKAQSVAERAAQTAVEEAKREAEKQNLTPPPTARETTQKTSTQSTPAA